MKIDILVYYNDGTKLPAGINFSAMSREYEINKVLSIFKHCLDVQKVCIKQIEKDDYNILYESYRYYYPYQVPLLNELAKEINIKNEQSK